MMTKEDIEKVNTAIQSLLLVAVSVYTLLTYFVYRTSQRQVTLMQQQLESGAQQYQMMEQQLASTRRQANVMEQEARLNHVPYILMEIVPPAVQKATAVRQQPPQNKNFQCTVTNITPHLAISVDMFMYDCSTQSYLLENRGLQSLKDGGSETVEFVQPYMNAADVFAWIQGRHGNHVDFVQQYLVHSNNCYACVVYSDISGRVYLIILRFFHAKDGTLNFLPESLYYDEADLGERSQKASQVHAAFSSQAASAADPIASGSATPAGH